MDTDIIHNHRLVISLMEVCNMSVQKIEEYKQQNGVNVLKVYCKPTKNFPDGKNYFYAPAEAIDLVNEYSWFLMQLKQRVIVCTSIRDYYGKHTLYFHKELFKFYQGFNWDYEIDHIDLVDFDNIDENLNAVTYSQNNINSFSRCYEVYFVKNIAYFRAKININSIAYSMSDYSDEIYERIGIRVPLQANGVLGRFDYNRSKLKEDDICRAQYELMDIVLNSKGMYNFDFKKYRRGSEDILDLERTGKISEEEATYQHILGYADNAWYMLRYGLEGYYKENHIPIPKYSIDEQGFMVHHITGKKLCPFSK